MVNNTNLPRHVAIMLDGNRRWANRKELPSWRGHYQGAKTLESLIEKLSFSKELKIEFVTFWGGSVSNLIGRPEKEVAALFDVYGKYFAAMAKRKELEKYGIRVRILGRWEKIVPEKVRDIFRGIIDKTRKNNSLNLSFLIAYDGKQEMLDAISELRVRSSKLKVTEEELKKHLWTRELPPVDLVIRTGVENDPHWSAGFMMWQCADSQLYFSKTLWPDFTVKELKKALKIYSKTKRRFGK